MSIGIEEAIAEILDKNVRKKETLVFLPFPKAEFEERERILAERMKPAQLAPINQSRKETI